MDLKYPVYIISKGRWDRRITVRSLDRLNIPYHIVVEAQEYDKYAAHIPKERILVLPQSYKDNYDVCDIYGQTKSTGSGPARNFCWDHSVERGYERHWIMDDNIGAFTRLNRNFEIKMSSGAMFRAVEDFVDRYENVALAGPQYDFFVITRWKYPPYSLNRRIFSCILIKNDIPYRWRARYNEDVDLSLRVLKDGWCTMLFNALLQEKATTQTIKGGNTSELYSEGTLEKSKMIVNLHPDVTKMSFKYNRWHHHVNYAHYKNNKLIKKADVHTEDGVNNYGMEPYYIDKRGNPIKPVDWQDEWHKDPGVINS
jgi:hypothetical protein